MSYRVGLIRVLTLDDPVLVNSQGRIIESMFPKLKVISRCIEDQPKGIYNEDSEKIAKPKIIHLAKQFEKEAVDAIIVSCAADPAVKELRSILSIPVIGAGSAAAVMALAFGDKIGVLNLTESTPKVIENILGDYLYAEETPKNIKTALDISTESGKKSIISAAQVLKAKGCDVILLGCAGMAPLAPSLREILKIPVIDPVTSAGCVTLYRLEIKNEKEVV